VEPVTRGTRLAAIFWIQSMIREEAKRDVLFDLNHVITALHGKVEHPAQMALSAVYHNLLRMWAET
jgi:PKHD-type hydroxylase